jgi:hypothetical protein
VKFSPRGELGPQGELCPLEGLFPPLFRRTQGRAEGLHPRVSTFAPMGDVKNWPRDHSKMSIVSYSASFVNIYNSTSSLVRFENKNIFLDLKETIMYVAYYNVVHSCKFT